MKKFYVALCVLAGFMVAGQIGAQDNAPAVSMGYTAAVLPFSESGEGVAGQGDQVSKILFAEILERNADIFMVERADLDKVFKEAELNLSGVVNPAQATKIGQMTGAKIIITGSVFKVKDKTFLVGKVIGTETSAVLGKSTSGTESIDVLTKKLAEGLSVILKNDAKKLMPVIRQKADIVAEINKKLGNEKRPKLFVKVPERHLGSQSYDPAVETEFQKIAQDTGFEIINNENDADIVIKGAGFSEFAGRRGTLISVKARVELKAIDKNGKILAVDRKTVANVDLAEQIAGKKALQEAAAEIAETMLPKLAAKK